MLNLSPVLSFPSLCFNYAGGGTSGNGSSRALVASLGGRSIIESESDKVLSESESERTLTPAQKEEVAAIRGYCLFLMI